MQPKESRLNLVSDSNSTLTSPQGSPTLLTYDGCQYVFEWQTSAACALQEDVGENCQVSDPVTGFVYNLTPLMKDTDYSFEAHEQQSAIEIIYLFTESQRQTMLTRFISVEPLSPDAMGQRVLIQPPLLAKFRKLINL